MINSIKGVTDFSSTFEIVTTSKAAFRNHLRSFINYLTTLSLLTSVEEHFFRRQEAEFKRHLILNGSSRQLGGLNQSLPTVEMLSSHHMKLNHTDIHTFLFYIQQPSTDPSSNLMSRTANALR